MIIFDNHLHLQMRGENVEAVKRFEKFGGTHINLTNVPDYSYPLDRDYYRRIYEDTIKIAKMVMRETKVKVLITIGPYPVDMVEMVKRGRDINEAKEFMLDGLKLAKRYVEEGICNAIGEIGRPHFEVPPEIWNASNEIILHGFEIARDIDCPVILHTESATESTFKEIAEMADRAGMSRDRVIKHYSPPIIDGRNHGIFPSVIASRKNVRESLKQGTRFLLETDFMDDPFRKNAVLPIESIPKRARFVIQEYGEKTWNRIMENMFRIYSIE